MSSTLFRWITALSLTAILVVAVVAVWLGWRLRQGPLPTPMIDRYVERTFAGRDPDLAVAFSGTVLVWAVDRRLPELRVLGLKLTRRDGTVVADFPEVAFRPSMRALLRGRLALGAIVLRGIKLSLTRNAEGRLFLTGSEPAAADPNAPSPLAWLKDPGDPNAPNAFLRHVSIRDAEIALDDRLSTGRWRADEAHVELVRRTDAVEADVRAVLRVRTGGGAAHLPITLALRASFGDSALVEHVEFRGRGEGGRWDRAAEGRQPLAIRSVAVTGRFAAEGEVLELDELVLETNAAGVRAKGRHAGAAKESRFEGSVSEMPVEELDLAWPAGVADGARAWVLGNLRDGRIAKAAFSLDHAKGATRFRLDADVAAMTVDYLSPLESLREVAGNVKVDEKHVEASVTAGVAGELRLARAALAIDLRAKPVTLAVEADVEGPTDAVLAYLDSPRLGFPSRYGIPTSGVGGRTSGTLALRVPLGGEEPGKALAIDARAALAGGSADGAIAVTVASGEVRKLEVERLRTPRNDLSGVLERGADGGYVASVRGAKLDFEPVLDRWRKSDPSTPGEGQPYDVTFDLERVTMANGVEISGARGAVKGRSGRLERVDASGTIEGGGVTKVLLEPVQGRSRLRATSEDAGRLLQAFGLVEGAKGGRLELYSFTDDRAGDATTSGRLEVRDLVITDAPLLARVLSLASFEGISDAFRGKGMTFSRARVPFTWAKDVIAVKDARAIGAIGLTADGTIRTSDGALDLAGEVIPAYTLNTALGKVPLIGDLFSGGKGGGLFGITYRVAGTRKAPEVAVNPLTALAPGKLREMFVSPWGM